ncbi:hypothetical protein BJX96DRAFT_169780 [Aspergillus floccosus]
MKFKDQFALTSLLIIAVLLLILPKNTEAAQCTANQISSLSVNGCDCQQSGVPVQCPLLAPQCGSPPTDVVPLNQYNGGQILWGEGCVDANFGCDGCYLWYGSLCHCLKSPGGCTRILPAVPGNPIWALLSNTAPRGLITTSQKLPGILQLDQAPEPYRGWQLGQYILSHPDPAVKYTRASGSLAMNSVATRTEEQIHIHVCDNPTSNLRQDLSKLPLSKYATLELVPGYSMWCQVATSSGSDIDVAKTISNYLKTIPHLSASCDKYKVGAGLITDSRDYSWACVTTGTKSAEELFCHFP